MLLPPSVVAHPANRSVPPSATASARRVTLNREKSRVGFVVVVSVIVFIALLPLRLRHFFRSSGVATLSASCFGASSCSTLLTITSLPAEPLHVFHHYVSELSGASANRDVESSTGRNWSDSECECCRVLAGNSDQLEAHSPKSASARPTRKPPHRPPSTALWPDDDLQRPRTELCR